MAFSIEEQGVARSGLIDNSRAQNYPDATAVGLNGVARAIDQAAGFMKSYRQSQKDQQSDELSKAATSGVDSILNDDILPAQERLTDPETVAGIPPQYRKEANNLSRARAQGKISDTYFNTSLTALSKKLKSQFPDQADKVDDLIAGASGVNPANRLRQSLLNEQQAQQKQYDEDHKEEAKARKEKMELVHSSLVLHDPEVQKLYEKAAGKPFAMDDFNVNALEFAKSGREFDDAVVKREKASLELADSKDSQFVKTVRRTAQNQINVVRDRVLFGAVNDDSGIMDRIQLKVQSGLSDGVLSPEEQTAILTDLNQAELGLKQAFQQFITNPDSRGGSYSTYLEQGDLRALEDSFMAPLNAVKDSFAGKDTKLSTLTIIKMDAEAKKSASQNPMIKQDTGMLERIQTMKTIYGSDFVERSMKGITQGKDAASQEERVLSAKIVSHVLTGSSLSKLIEEGAQSGAINSAAAPNLAEKTVVSAILDPSTDKEQAQKAASSLFAETETDYIEKYGKSDPFKIFDQRVSPEMTEKLKGTAAFELYSTWAKRQVSTLMAKANRTLVGDKKNTSNIDVRWDEKAEKFVSEYRDPSVGTLLREGPVRVVNDAFEAARFTETKKATDDMNRYLEKMSPILKVEGMSKTEFMEAVLGSDTVGSTIKEGSALERIRAAGWEYLNTRDLDENAEEAPQAPSKFNPISPKKYKEQQDQFKARHNRDKMSGLGLTVNTIAGFEGYLGKAAWDVNAFRGGYGSDTITKEDGSVIKVTKDSVFTKEDAQRDLVRRTEEFEREVAEDVGTVYESMPEGARAALVSVAYNYGSLPSRVLKAARTGDTGAIADAIEGLQGHNKGVNRKRRLKEAALARRV